MRVILGFLWIIPRPVALWIGRVIGRIGHCLDRRHRAVSAEAIAASFPEKSPEEVKRITLESFEHLGMCIADLPRIKGQTPETLAGIYDNSAMQRVVDLCSGDKPVFIVTGHIGFWELTGFALGASNLDIVSIARPMDNPYINGYVDGIRESGGGKIVSKFGGMRPLLRHLKKGGTVGTLIDQDAGKSGVFVDFFGRLASTYDATARLAMRTGAHVLPVAAFRKPDRSYYLWVGDVIEFVDTGDLEADVIENTRRMNVFLCEGISRHPEQWLWMHRRWKTRPPGESQAAAAEAKPDADASQSDSQSSKD